MQAYSNSNQPRRWPRRRSAPALAALPKRGVGTLSSLALVTILAAASPGNAGQPPNDQCANGTAISLGDTPFNATGAGPDGPQGCDLPGPDIWYNFTAGFTGVLRVEVDDLGAVVGVYDGCGCPAETANLLGCAFVFTPLEIPVVAGNCYKMQLTAFFGPGIGTLSLTLAAPTGACCLNDGSCVDDLLETECVGLGGVFEGEGTDCAAVTCPVLLGACCLNDGSCVDGLLETACVALGGVFQGEGSECTAPRFVVVDCTNLFEDIFATGIEAPAASNTDDAGDVVPIGFTFSFFGNAHTEIGISSNGYLTFGSELGVFTNVPIPADTDPNDAIFPWWDDWNPDVQGFVHYLTLGDPGQRRFIAQWTAVAHFSTGGAATFQAVLFEGSNCIEFRYGSPLHFDSPTVGVENPDGSDGFAVDETTDLASACVELCPVGVQPLCFVDCNGNGIPDEQEIADGNSPDCNGNGIPDDCDVDPDDPDGDGLVSNDTNSNGIPDECEDLPCASDLDLDGTVNVLDLIVLLLNFGPCENPQLCPADFNGDGSVNVLDLIEMLLNLGPCPSLAPPCPWDVNGDNVVDEADFQSLLSNLGPCPAGDPCPFDFNQDGIVDFTDAQEILVNFGPCP